MILCRFTAAREANFKEEQIIREFYGGECANLNDLTTVIKLGISQNPLPVSGTSQSHSANVLHSSENGTEKFSSMVEAIIDYTAHLYEARECHEAICKHKPEFTDFLTRCNSTAFSKRLDLWHFLDIPMNFFLKPFLLNDVEYPESISCLIPLTSCDKRNAEYVIQTPQAVQHDSWTNWFRILSVPEYPTADGRIAQPISPLNVG
ncbi:uncharacterized protein DEA37_0011539 [Paragonimus westermani]|uniref:Uncharacterized protein n=1 Tax=Paragonimus westermani TaxID=34504 RepID=A0A5J4N8I8_9TREM|nr:uncharacterized protein DEA37_0011539 [Paragonimus westermani]